MTETLPAKQPLEPVKKTGILGSFKQHILHPEKSASDVAWSFGVGLAIALNPLLGFHTWLVILLCVIFCRLHRPLTLMAAFINNPWTMVPIATASAYLGNLMLGRGWHLDLSGIYWGSLGWRSVLTRGGFQHMIHMFKPVLAPYLLGGMVLSLLGLFVGYLCMLKIAQNLRRLHLPHLHHPSCSHDSSH